MCCTGQKWQNVSPVIAEEDQDKAVLSIYITAKDVLPALLY